MRMHLLIIYSTYLLHKIGSFCVFLASSRPEYFNNALLESGRGESCTLLLQHFMHTDAARTIHISYYYFAAVALVFRMIVTVLSPNGKPRVMTIALITSNTDVNKGWLINAPA